MRFKNLSQLKRPQPLEITLKSLPQHILMAEYARDKAFKINELVNMTFEESFEWYGFTLANQDRPELIIDIGLPQNDLNLPDYTALGSERIAQFQESLPKELIINGWIHSHGALNYKHFSHTDEQNHLIVLDFVAPRTRKPLSKKEVAVQDLVLLEKDRFEEKDMEKGSVCLITNGPITEARIMETVYGSFCYSIVIGDAGWHEQEIHYRERGILSGHTTVSSKAATIEFVDTGKTLSQIDISALSDEVEKKIKPHTDPPPELIERM
ncbi:MAG: hypothetical protein JRD87_08645 [Deltaproteobacteria bacterium]|jgi:hypothetical protein|nr:hypothetical protein [Deltaproteobacteria bacterium]MBW2239403.1 hypothetical protein [Deltaproteobacteria bacterium]MBW2572984.1 hypothetical protein [Deltaproteobacteria bacterium]MBW2669941.1 hypothetical protein [Deltaproteobacteria bacterium]MBW2711922.1 hypothetical protein [Deltaproteobacteria bacterium]